MRMRRCFLFHLLEFSDVDFDLDVDALNARWADAENIDSWSQMVIKHTRDSVSRITQAPESGIWKMDDDGMIHYSRFDYHRRAVASENEAFFLRISGAGDYLYEGADLGHSHYTGPVDGPAFRIKPARQKLVERHQITLP